MRLKLTGLFALLTLLFNGAVFADQTSVERMLRENREFIEFLNVCVTNFGDKEKDQFFDLYELHFNADISFLQADYSRSFRSIYESQKKQTALYTEVLAKYYLEDSKAILDRIAPDIIKSKNSAARLYLTLGYRDRATSRNFQVMADAQNPRLYSEKIFRYEESIKIARRAMRFAYLALFESRDVEMKKYIYAHLFEMEREKGNQFYTRFLGKTGEPFTNELVLKFDDYEKRYQSELAAKKTSDKPAEPQAKPAEQPVTQSPVGPASPKAAEPVFEKKVEREVRFRRERSVAEYVRNAEFGKAEDIIVKYVDDFNYKLTQATLEVLAAKEKDRLALDFERMKTHHADNFSRLTKPSVIDGFASRLKVKDDIKKGVPASAEQTKDQTAKKDAADQQTKKIEAGAAKTENTQPVNPGTTKSEK